MGAVWDYMSDGSREEEDSWFWGLSTRVCNFVDKCGAPNCNQWGICGIGVQKCMNHRSCGLGWCVGSTESLVATWPVPKLLWTIFFDV